MIDWMQKHRKALVPVMWVASLTFVGAGLVGWGQYDMNINRAKSVAKVGDESISLQEFNYKYNMYYDYYNNQSDGKFTREDAEKIGLEDLVVADLINQNLLVNYAKDLGISVSDADVAEFVTNLPQFQQNGKFDKSAFNYMLRQSGISEKEFIQNLKKDIMIDKLNYALNLNANDNDIEAIAGEYFIQDKISAKVIEKPKNVEVNEAEIKEYWEKHKNNFLTQKTYELNSYFVAIADANASDDELKKYYDEHRSTYRSSDDKILEFIEARAKVLADFSKEQSEKNAKKEYLLLKKNEKQFTNTMLVSDDNVTFPLGEIADKKPGEVVKPFEFENGFLIVKVAKINEPKAMEFEMAKPHAMDGLIAEKSIKVLKEKAENELKDFNTTDAQFVSIDQENFMDLSTNETREFLSTIYGRSDLVGYVVLDDKAVVYKILEQKIQNSEKLKEYHEILAEKAFNIKNNLFRENLMKALRNRYKIELYRGNKN